MPKKRGLAVDRSSLEYALTWSALVLLPIGNRPHVGQIRFLSAAKIVNKRAGRTHGRGMTVEPEPFESAGSELIK